MPWHDKMERKFICSVAVREGVISPAKKYRVDYSLNIDEILKVGGAVTCNGVKEDVPWKTYYDLVLNYISVSRLQIIEGGGNNVRIVSKLLFTVNRDVPERAA